jgi:two-component system sensor histidine kinase HydH
VERDEHKRRHRTFAAEPSKGTRTGAMSPSPASAHDEIEEHLRRQYAELAYIAGGLAHEIKNPLSTIRLNLALLTEDLARSEDPKDKRALQKLRVVERECERLQEIVEQFLQFARASELKLEVCNLNAVITELTEFVMPAARQRNVEILCYLRSDLPLVRLDRALFKQALLNLLLNAQDAMPNGGQIVITTQPVEGGVQISVIDTGTGMPPEVLKKIFRPFFSTRRHGTGLGLPTVKKIVEAHRGTISVQSEVGRGTKFTIQLPVGEWTAVAQD